MDEGLKTGTEISLSTLINSERNEVSSSKQEGQFRVFKIQVAENAVIEIEPKSSKLFINPQR